MADRFSLNGDVRELKIGRSFEQNSSQQNSFHTVRYDFKPASVDSTRDGILQIDESQSVSITVPHMHGNGQTNFSGRVKPANPKECVLIIDRETGEITLEALKSQILVKKTRPEKNPEPPALSVTSTSTSSTSASTRPQMPTERSRPTNARPPPMSTVSLHDHARSSSPASLVMPTMSSSEVSETKKKPTPPPATAAVLSESSSSSDSSSDDSSSSSDSGSDNDEESRPAASAAMSMPSFTSAIPSNTPPSMPSFMQTKTNGPPQGRAPQPLPQRAAASKPPAPPVASSRPQAMPMPQFLNDDLQLSESEEDSD